MKKTYPQIDIIYILTRKGSDIKFYTYNEEITKSGDEITLSSVDIGGTTYTFPSDSNNFYYLIIREKNEQQYVIKG